MCVCSHTLFVGKVAYGEAVSSSNSVRSLWFYSCSGLLLPPVGDQGFGIERGWGEGGKEVLGKFCCCCFYFTVAEFHWMEMTLDYLWCFFPLSEIE